MATLHNNRKVTAHMPDDQEEEAKRVLDRKETTSRSSLLEQAFQKMNQATFEALTFQEFSKEFPLELVRGNQAFLRDLHSQLINVSSSAIQKEFHRILYEIKVSKKLQELQFLSSRSNPNSVSNYPVKDEKDLVKLRSQCAEMKRRLDAADLENDGLRARLCEKQDNVCFAKAASKLQKRTDRQRSNDAH
mmetsp:Transcript_6074/g.13447  ORF Transcript_6074/g.13447 Transcript_6074/m.13447 type:complete len:190 (-) Transcript_6074:191-760(-)